VPLSLTLFPAERIFSGETFMSDQPRTRQELYEQIRRQGGRDIFVLEEMIRLGFWQDQSGLPNDPADEIRRAAELRAELDTLRKENRRLHDE
jgi:hypothetical protein